MHDRAEAAAANTCMLKDVHQQSARWYGAHSIQVAKFPYPNLILS